jgi:hypothetical protein
MNKGALIFAHNNREIDYALMSIISGGLAKKHLNIPVTLVTDTTTREWMEKSNIYSKAKEVFENIIEVEKPVSENSRRLYDGVEHNKVVPFANSNRCLAWELTPYDRTLLLDSDYLIFSDHLNQYWDLDEDILISESINDVYDQKRLGYHDRYVSDTGVHLYWATTVIFTKNQRSKSFFDMVDFVKENYQYYGDLFRFNTQQYRNDISFSVAKHILSGFETDKITNLPPVLTALDRDVLHSVDDDGKLTFLVSPKLDSNYCVAAFKNTDIHVMNKKSIVRNAEALLGLI